MSNLYFRRLAQDFDSQPNIPFAALPEVVGDQLHQRFGPATVHGVKRVLLCFGSRGIPNYGLIAKATAEYFSRELKVSTAAVAAMGTHGGDDAEKEIALLESRHGITAESLGVPIIPTKETEVIGTTARGFNVHVFREACESGTLLFPVNRIKAHTHFVAAHWEGRTILRGSGPFKMLAIGVSKGVGAREVHAKAATLWDPPQRKNTETLGDGIEEVSRYLIASGLVLGGLGIVDNANHQTAAIGVLDPACYFEDEQPLLEQANSLMPDIPLVPDVLIIDEVGKNISGTGAAPQVIRRWPDFREVQQAPAVVAMLRLTEETHGSAFGIGWADVTTEPCVESIDVDFTRANTHGAGDPELGEPPAEVAPNDREAFAQAIALGVERCHRPEDELSVLYIKSTGALRSMYLHAPEQTVARLGQRVADVGEAKPLAFLSTGALDRAALWSA